MEKSPRIAVFCGSNDGSDLYVDAAIALGNALLEFNIDLVYGAGARGLMGKLAKTVKDGGGYVVGVNPDRFHATGKHQMENDEYIVVQTLQELKEIMISRADAFIALPGGIGTLDEIMEVLSLRQLGFCDKPIGFLNIGSYYDRLLSFFEFMISEGFMRKQDLDLFIVSEKPRELVIKILDLLKP